MVTDIEQTLLDLADWDEVLDLARQQRLHAAYVRARWIAARVLPEPPPAWPARRPVSGADLLADRGNDADFGIGDPDAAA